MGVLEQYDFFPLGPHQKRYIESKTFLGSKGVKGRKEAKRNRVRRERRKISLTDIERKEEEEEAIGGTFALGQVVEVTYLVRGIGDQVHR